MANYSTNEFRSGLKIIIDQDPCIIVENAFVKPGKGQALNRVRIKNLKTGKTVDKTFKSGESVEAADLVDTEMQYLYADGEFWHFMKPDTFEQYAADEKAVGDAKNWISDGDVCQITLWNNTIMKAGVDYEIKLPHGAFNRKIGEFASIETDPDGNVVANGDWEHGKDDWLPSQADGDYIASLMKPEIETGKFANWIAPPKVGINNKPGDFEYVKIDS